MSNRETKERNYWPYAITGMILTVVVLGVWTVKIAVKNPVQEADTYMMKYQDVDENINEILAEQKKFFAKYRIDLSGNRFKIGQNVVKVAVSRVDGTPVTDAKILVVVTRPTTSRFDKRLEKFSDEEGVYVSEPFEIDKPGRWNIQAKVEIDGLRGYETYKTFVK
ncbi:FixH family protein [Hydrogenimonas sp.]